jgi:hypothetical protein
MPMALTALTAMNTIAAGAITGAMAGYVGTGTLKGAAFGAVSGAIFGAMHDVSTSLRAGSIDVGRVMAHGYAGGILSVAQGGKFGSGFASAGVTQIASQAGFMPDKGANGAGERIKNALAAAVVGGTTSEITGGKFANGAITGAFSRLLNDLSLEDFFKNERSDNEIRARNLQELKEKIGYKKGETVVLGGKRGLNILGTQISIGDESLLDMMNIEFLHEDIFIIDSNGELSVQGYGDRGISDEYFSQRNKMEQYQFSQPFYKAEGSFNVQEYLSGMDFNNSWSKETYGLKPHNCQDYAGWVRKHLNNQ